MHQILIIFYIIHKLYMCLLKMCVEDLNTYLSLDLVLQSGMSHAFFLKVFTIYVSKEFYFPMPSKSTNSDEPATRYSVYLTTTIYPYKFYYSMVTALTSISGPPTQRTAGSSDCSNKWFASSSKPHWQITRLAPLSFTFQKKSKCENWLLPLLLASSVLLRDS